ncbi:hypothetical protein DRO24_04290, partial [Candidatus Bathyarchaeota archaeon]
IFVSKQKRSIPLEVVSVATSRKKVFWTDKELKTKKIAVTHPGLVPFVRGKFPVVFETDIPYLERFLIDIGGVDPITEGEVLIYDVEWDPLSKKPFLAGALTAHFVWSLEEPPSFEVDEGDVQVFEGEQLYDFVKLLNRARIVCGHNILFADNAIIAANFGDDVVIWKNNDAVFIRTAINIDTAQLAMKFVRNLPADLKNLARFLGVSVEDRVFLPRSKISDTYRRDRERVIKYNEHDVIETARILRLFLFHALAIQNVMHYPIEFFQVHTGAGTVPLYEFAVALRIAREYYIPAKPRNREFEGEYASPYQKRELYRGALKISREELRRLGVLMQKIENVGEIDITSQYPTALIKYNVSPETVVLSDKAPDGRRVFAVEMETGLKTVEVLEREGILVKICREINDAVLRYKRTVRKEIREGDYPSHVKEVAEQIYKGLKGLRNAIYGFMGTESRYVNPYAAALIAKIGREWLNDVRSLIERKGGKIVYWDTDGCYFVPADAITEGDLSVFEFDAELDRLDWIYPIAGNTYIAQKDGSIEIRGSPIKRGDMPTIIKEKLFDIVRWVVDHDIAKLDAFREELLNAPPEACACVISLGREDYKNKYRERLRRRLQRYIDPSGRVEVIVVGGQDVGLMPWSGVNEKYVIALEEFDPRKHQVNRRFLLNWFYTIVRRVNPHLRLETRTLF